MLLSEIKANVYQEGTKHDITLKYAFKHKRLGWDKILYNKQLLMEKREVGMLIHQLFSIHKSIQDLVLKYIFN
jgi:hypothetical protein